MYDYIRRLRALREDNDLTQTQIAELLGTSQTMYARYERCANELPVRHLVKLCELYNVSSDQVLGIHRDSSRPEGCAVGIERQPSDSAH